MDHKMETQLIELWVVKLVSFLENYTVGMKELLKVESMDDLLVEQMI
jgi:hypothetical protein